VVYAGNRKIHKQTKQHRHLLKRKQRVSSDLRLAGEDEFKQLVNVEKPEEEQEPANEEEPEDDQTSDKDVESESDPSRKEEDKDDAPDKEVRK
jgi:hypothetical protein